MIFRLIFKCFISFTINTFVCFCFVDSFTNKENKRLSIVDKGRDRLGSRLTGFGIKDNKCTFHLPTRWTEERAFYTWKRRISFFGPH